ncbi:hypothetical protein FACS1894206_10070 [Deltaproteobacteria bacterium]|nr:hypothetical protein FACS1894206_10070 [Deltaproteobacteria bacterium]
MASTATLMGIGLAVSAGSQILGGLASYGESKSAAKGHEQAADVARKQAANAAAQERDKYGRLAAAQRAKYGASGIDVNQGSALDILADTDSEGAVSAMQLLYGGELEAWNQKNKARAAKASGRGALIGGILGGAGTGLMGAAKMGLFDSADPLTTFSGISDNPYEPY